MDPNRRAAIEKFGAAIARLQERHVEAARRELGIIASPKTAHNRAVSEYYSSMDREDFLIAWMQGSIESVLHDLFFLFETNEEELKIILRAEDGTEFNLTESGYPLQALPLEWIENGSSVGLETSRYTEFLSEKLNLRETRQNIASEGAGATR